MDDDSKMDLTTNLARDKAEVLLEQLLETKRQAADQHERMQRKLTGQAPPSTAAIDKAIASTQSMIEKFSQQMERGGG